jgi:Mg-chelatase subunit ChlD
MSRTNNTNNNNTNNTNKRTIFTTTSQPNNNTNINTNIPQTRINLPQQTTNLISNQQPSIQQGNQQYFPQNTGFNLPNNIFNPSNNIFGNTNSSFGNTNILFGNSNNGFINPNPNTTSSVAPRYKLNGPPEAYEMMALLFGGYNDDEDIDISDSVKLDKIKENNHHFNEDDIKVQLKLSKSYLHETSNGETLPMLLNIDVKEVSTDIKSNIDLICLIDKSGSMQGQKMNLLIESFNNILEYLGDNDRLSIIVFDNQALRLTPLLRMTQDGKNKTLQALKTVYANGGTNIGSAFAMALNLMMKRRKVNSVTSVLILSDGIDGNAENSVKQLLNDNQSKLSTFTINTFGYGNDHDPKMMSALAQLKDGSFYFIDKLETIDEVFVDCLGGLISVVAQNVNIEIKPNSADEILPGINIVKAYGVDSFWKKTGDNYKAELLQAISGKKYSYVLETRIPKLQDLDVAVRSFLIAQAEITFSDLKGNKYIKSCDCDVTFVEDNIDLEDDQEVLVNYYRVKTAELTNNALKYSSSGQYDKAKSLLSDFRTEMSISSVKNDESVLNFIKDIDSSLNNIRPEVFMNQGRHYMMENYMANMNQQSNINSNMCYMNKRQRCLQSDLRDRKTKK